MTEQDIRAEYMQAVFDGRWAAAEYLVQYLPVWDLENDPAWVTSDNTPNKTVSGRLDIWEWIG